MRRVEVVQMSSVNKVMSAKKAIERFVSKGDCVSFGGFTVNRNPVALVHELIRQQIGKLHVVMHSGSQVLDLLIGAGLVNLVEIAYGANGRFASTCFRFRQAVEDGSIKVEDYTNYQITLRFMAGSMGLPYLPTYSSLGSDVIDKWGIKRKDRKKNQSLVNEKLILGSNPFAKDSPIVLVPAVNPDVTLLHVHRASEDGIARIEGLPFVDIEQARASKCVIISCEELVSSDELRQEPWRNCFPHSIVSAVVHQPFGAHPTACYLQYDYDAEHLNSYRDVASDDVMFAKYLDLHVMSVDDFDGYLNVIGEDQLNKIRASPGLGYRERRKVA